ncbi:MAG: hypothetical protein JO061_20310 [Acidobacteriaceae bacterium]|nr:hypothetical protein [Acidobacteriaceae bacterium]
MSRNTANGPQIIGQTEVILSNEDLTGVVITPFRPAQVRVRVVIEGEEDKPLTRGSAVLNPVVADREYANFITQFQPQDGTYIINDVPPGKYSVWFNNASNCYLKSVQSGNSVLNPNSVEVSEGTILDLLLIFSRNVATLSGDVEVPQDQSKQTPNVIILPAEPGEVSDARTYSLEADPSLHFSIARTWPGKYVVFAVEDTDLDLGSDPEVINLVEPEAVGVQLHENERATVHLKVIPKEKTDAIRKRLGL